MQSYLNEIFDLRPKHSPEGVLQKSRNLCGVVKNPKRRFRFTANFTANLSVPNEAAMQEPPHDAVDLETTAQLAGLDAVVPIAWKTQAQQRRGGTNKKKKKNNAMESYLIENFDLQLKHPSDELLHRKGRNLSEITNNQRPRLRIFANPSVYEAAAMQERLYDVVDLETTAQPAGLDAVVPIDPEEPAQALEVVVGHRKIDWTKIKVVICLAVDPGFPRQIPPDDAVGLESPAQPAELGAVAPIAPAQPARGDGKLDWTKMLVAFFLEATIALALLPVQGHSEVPTSFHWFCQAMLLGFCSLFISESIPYNFVMTAALLQKLGLFFMFTAILIAITSQVPFYFKCASWAAYFISILVIFISRCFIAWKLVE